MYRLKSYAKRVMGKIGLWQQLWVEPTNCCQLKCDPCFHGCMLRPKTTMTYDQFRQIVMLNKSHGLAQISFTGWGEPLLCPEIAAMVRLASSKGIFTVLPTNAIALTEKLSEKLLTAGLGAMRFSVDGNPDTYEAVRHIPFKAVFDNIAQYCELQKKLRPKMEQPAFVMVVNDRTKNDIAEWTNFWKPYGRTILQRQSNFTSHRTAPCKVLGESFYVWADGDVSPCCLDYEASLVLGNAFKQPLHKIVRGKELADLIEKHGKLDFPSPCDRCGEWNGILPHQDLEYRFS